jgi:UDP-glucose 4-epimerase
MSKILVTGGAGFIGKHLCESLIEDEYEVKCLDNFYRFKEEKISELKSEENFKLIEADIRDREEIEPHFEDVDHVVHLAAQSDVAGSLENKDYSFETNVEGTWNVLRASEENNVEKFLFASSREVYGDTEGKVSEDEELNPKNYYGASKVSGEMYLDQFEEYSNLETYALRLANVYGPGDKNRVIPIFLEKAQNNKTLELYGGNQVLDFVWIEDTIEAFTQIIENGSKHRKINIGSGEGTSVRELAHLIKDVSDSESEIKEKEERGFDTQKFISENQKQLELNNSTKSLKAGLKLMRRVEDEK